MANPPLRGRSLRLVWNFSVHTWLAIKKEAQDPFVSYHKMAFVPGTGAPGIYAYQGEPSYYWSGDIPRLLWHYQGTRAKDLIKELEEAIDSYPHKSFYLPWPGPNSNTFTSYVLRRSGVSGVELPSNAIGKSFIAGGWPVDITESNTGVEFSVLGLIGFQIGLSEGIELSLLGLSLGIDVLRPALKLPIVGRLGLKDEAILHQGP